MTHYDLILCVTIALNSLQFLNSHKSQDHSPFHDPPWLLFSSQQPEKWRKRMPVLPHREKFCWEVSEHTSSIRMRKVALCPCSMTSFPSEVRMCSPRGAFPGHFSILAMYFSLKPSVQLLDTILRYLGSSNKRTLGSDGGWKSSFVLFLLCLSTLMHVFFQRLTACMIPSLEGSKKPNTLLNGWKPSQSQSNLLQRFSAASLTRDTLWRWITLPC